jgi:superfamily I DNA/RNA helicase
MSDDELLAFGVPPEWVSEVRKANEETILDLALNLPAEAAEGLLQIATGAKPQPRQVTVANPFEHPDAQRRFRLVSHIDELKQALEYPWEKWTVFLHPAQRAFVDKEFGGPARVAGSAGTGKTIVAIHRAASVARRYSDARLLLTTFSDALASSLRVKLGRLIGLEPRILERIDVASVESVARRLYQKMFGVPELVSDEEVRTIAHRAMNDVPDQKFSLSFIVAEWTEVVDAWQLDSWESYRDVARLGRKTRLPEKQREMLWRIFVQMRSRLRERGLITQADMNARLTKHIGTDGKSPYDFVVVDEAQDVSIPQLRFLESLGRGKPDALFFAGDLGQRIFQLPFSWKSLGVDVRGRSTSLRVNYRTSHQIRIHADRLLGKQVTDVDGNEESRTGTVSVFNGPNPDVREFETSEDEVAGVAEWLRARVADGLAPEEVGVFVRSDAQVLRAEAAIKSAGLTSMMLDNDLKTARNRVSIGTMHLSKGLEFRACIVMACDDEVLPLQARIESVTDVADLEEVYETERHLLYVACTRARDNLLVSGVRPVSEFLADFRQ